MPFENMDLIWYGWENGYSANRVGNVAEKTTKEIENIYKSSERKRRTTEYLRMRPIF